VTQSGRGPLIDLAQGTASNSSLWLFVGLADVIISISPTPAALAERSSLRLGSLYSWLRAISELPLATIGPITVRLRSLLSAITMVGVPALRTMSDGGFRHLPVVENGRIWGIVSRGDFRGLEIDQLDEEDHLRASADGLVGTRPCTAENNRVDLAYPSETGHHAEIRTHRHLATTPDSPAICRLGG
jgi:hypothetical protein